MKLTHDYRGFYTVTNRKHICGFPTGLALCDDYGNIVPVPYQSTAQFVAGDFYAM